MIVGQPEVLQGIKDHLAGLESVKPDETLGYLGQEGPLPAPVQVEVLPLQDAPAADVPPTLVEGGPVPVLTSEAAQETLAVGPQPLPEAPADEESAVPDEKGGKASK